MKILFLCGYFSKENEQEICDNTKVAVEYSANIFQEKLIEALENGQYNFEILSAPFIGAFPNAYKKVFFKGFQENQNRCKYVNFNNIWGVRNFSRAYSLKHAMTDFINSDDNEKLIIAYSPHTPFLDAAVYAKKKDPRIKICLIVPDLPQYMNLNAKKSLLYKVGKKYDIAKFNRLNKSVDSYVLLTDAMREKIDIHNRPYMVVEGIVSKSQLEKMADRSNLPNKEEGCKYIVYTGKMYEKFGVKDLLDAFESIPDDSLRLLLCGVGDLTKYIEKLSEKDKRIIYLGQVSPEESLSWVKSADLLVNPRRAEGEYTRYSFPSKNIEYLLSGNPVLAYLLDGMKNCYKDYIISLGDKEMKDSIIDSLHLEKHNDNNFIQYAKENLYNENVIKKIVEVSY